MLYGATFHIFYEKKEVPQNLSALPEQTQGLNFLIESRTFL